MSVIASVLRGGTNSYSSPQEAFSPYAADLLHDGVFDSTYLRVTAQTVPNFTVLVKAGAALVSATPSSESLRKFRVTLSADYTVAATANSTGSTKYDILYLALPPAALHDPAVTGDLTEAATLLWERHNSAGEPLTAVGIPLAEVAVSNGAVTIVTANITDRRRYVADGWFQVGTGTFTYGSTTGNLSTMTYPADITGRVTKGTKVELIHTVAGVSTKKYFTATLTALASNVTTLTITGGSDYTLSAGTISNVYFSNESAPVGHPIWFQYAPTYGTGGADTWTGVTSGVKHFKVDGDTCVLGLSASGNRSGSSGNHLEASIPLPANSNWGSAQIGWCGYVNTAGGSFSSWMYISGGNLVAIPYDNRAYTAGTCAIQAQIAYRLP